MTSLCHVRIQFFQAGTTELSNSNVNSDLRLLLSLSWLMAHSLKKYVVHNNPQSATECQHTVSLVCRKRAKIYRGFNYSSKLT